MGWGSLEGRLARRAHLFTAPIRWTLSHRASWKYVMAVTGWMWWKMSAQWESNSSWPHGREGKWVVFRRCGRVHRQKTPAQAELERGTLESGDGGDSPGHPPEGL